MLDLRCRLQPAAVRAALAKQEAMEDDGSEPSDGEKGVVALSRRDVQKLTPRRLSFLTRHCCRAVPT